MKLIDAVQWAKKMRTRAGEFMLTSMDKDGTKDGYDIELTRTISEAVSIPVIASGGPAPSNTSMKTRQRRLMRC